jgi:hypothetical protein
LLARSLLIKASLISQKILAKKSAANLELIKTIWHPMSQTLVLDQNKKTYILQP